jgi:uncharacterized protein YceK
MKTVALIIVLQLIVTLLSGCAEFETKIEEMQSQQHYEDVEQLCCIPDPDFPQSCGGWLLCEL